MKRPMLLIETNRCIPGFCLDHIRFSCYTSRFFTGYDIQGSVQDLISFNEHPDCEIYEHIRCVEQIKQKVSTTFIRHLSHIRSLCLVNIKLLCHISSQNRFNELEKWISHVKMFYKLLLSEDKIYKNINPHILGLKEIENALESLFQLEELNMVSRNFKSNSMN